jgi:Ca-activated chloride channel family protein
VAGAFLALSDQLASAFARADTKHITKHMLSFPRMLVSALQMITRPSCRSVAALAIIVVLGSFQHPLSIEAQEPRPTFKTTVAVVPITAVVRDSRNRIVRDLTRDDFHVLENSLPRPIVDFRATDNAPVSVALLFDTSGSMRGPNLGIGKTVVDRLLRALNPASDEIALFTFDKRLRQETPFTQDLDGIRTALNNTDAWGLTSLYDAIAETAKRLADRRSQRRAVIVITDGFDTSSTLTSPQVSGVASAIDVPVYIVSVIRTRAAATDDDGDGDTASLAYWTGGDVSHATTPEEANRAVGALMAELRQQYFLAIESASGSAWYRLDVKTKRRGLTVRARSGYFAAPFGRAELGD